MRTVEEIKCELISRYAIKGLEYEYYKTLFDGMTNDHLEEIFQAEKLIGENIYHLTTDSPFGYEETRVTKYIATKNTVKIYAKCVYDDWGNAKWEFKISDIGKTVFLSKEQAEKALEGDAK